MLDVIVVLPFQPAFQPRARTAPPMVRSFGPLPNATRSARVAASPVIPSVVSFANAARSASSPGSAVKAVGGFSLPAFASLFTAAFGCGLVHVVAIVRQPAASFANTDVMRHSGRVIVA